MKINSVIVHILHKEQATKLIPSPRATIEFSDSLFDVRNRTIAQKN